MLFVIFFTKPIENSSNTIMGSFTPDSTMEKLSSIISANVSIVREYLHSSSYPEPSFDRESPSTTLPAAAPENIRVARQALIEASLKLQQLATGPSEFLPNLAVGVSCVSRIKVLQYYSLCGI